jgi:hypothetical protein
MVTNNCLCHAVADARIETLPKPDHSWAKKLAILKVFISCMMDDEEESLSIT